MKRFAKTLETDESSASEYMEIEFSDVLSVSPTHSLSNCPIRNILASLKTIKDGEKELN